MSVIALRTSQADLPVEDVPPPSASIRFGTCELLPGARTLLLDGSPVEIGSRAFDLLTALVHSPGEVMSKDAIMRRVWPTTTVEEANLRVQLSCLRRALGPERWRIKTIPGRGYLFTTGELSACDPAERRRPADVPSGETVIVVLDAGPEARQFLQYLLAGTGTRLRSLTVPFPLEEGRPHEP